MQLEDSRGLASVLLARVADGAGSPEIAEVVVAALDEVGLVLSPIIGKRGVVALLKRSVHVASARHSWLRANFDDGAPLDFEPLRSVFAGQSGGEAAAAGGELLGGFGELLSTLIGFSLTERLLGSAWSHVTGGPSAQEASSWTAR